MSLLKNISTAFDRVCHELGTNDIHSRTRIAGIEAFDEADMHLAHPTRISYSLKMMPDFSHTECDMKLLAHGNGFGPSPQIPSGLIGVFDAMTSHVIPIGSFPLLEGSVKIAEFNAGLCMGDIFDLRRVTDPMLKRLVEKENKSGAMFGHNADPMGAGLRALGYR